MKGAILEHYEGKGQTVHSTTYSAVLKDKLKLAFATKKENCC
jgi:hypothetical protein